MWCDTLKKREFRVMMRAVQAGRLGIEDVEACFLMRSHRRLRWYTRWSRVLRMEESLVWTRKAMSFEVGGHEGVEEVDTEDDVV